MACFGLELLYEVSQPLRRKEDCLITFLHWKLISCGFKSHIPSKGCEHSEQADGSELLPKGWNSDCDAYELHYSKSTDLQSHILVKAIPVEEQVIVSLLCDRHEQVFNLILETKTWIGSNFQNFKEAFLDISGLETLFNKEILSPLNACLNPHSDKQDATSSRKPMINSVTEGLIVERGASNMVHLPRHGRKPLLGPPETLPVGAVPPGARFDPFGPPDLTVPFKGPAPSHVSGDPDNDHLRPPEYHDMFM